ncbi:MAG TPA: outer membrane beta-barrel protein [Candidatus Limnocylindrales bacterium]|nr:outer membrane beta-barrel protein [Candidatus Limnocylindrales bacterium]
MWTQSDLIPSDHSMDGSNKRVSKSQGQSFFHQKGPYDRDEFLVKSKGRKKKNLLSPYLLYIPGLLLYIMTWSTCGLAQESKEREISLSPTSPGRETPLDLAGLPKEPVGIKINGFIVGSLSYNSRIQIVPEFAGSAPALANPGATNFSFDKFGLALSRTFASWLSASGAIEVESHRNRHAHGFNPEFGCPEGGTSPCIERFGSEEPEIEVGLDKFNITGIVPVGNGLSLSLGRFDVPFGIERHDEPLLLTATNSEVFRFGRPQKVTGFWTAYQVNPKVNFDVFLVNRWESETTEDDFNDNNKGKTVGGRIGFTPLPTTGLLNFGIGGIYGPEQENNDSSKRWVIDLDATWNPISKFLLTGEFVFGSESDFEARQVGQPIFQAPIQGDVSWFGFYLLGHYDARPWLGFSLRYGYFDDQDGARTGIQQKLQSLTFAPVIHLSRLIPDLRPTGATFARTRHPIDWVDLKFEYRYNHSNRPAFSDEEPGVDILEADKTSHQFQFQAVVNF